MSRALVTPPAIFFIFYASRLLALVLIRGIVAALAFGAFQNNEISHDSACCKV
jgi:hypothetical protein